MGFEMATIINGDEPDPEKSRFQVLFNPEEYTVSKDNNFAQMAVPGLRSPLLQFVHGNLKTLEMELLVDTFEQHMSGSRVINRAGQDVRDVTSRLMALMDINPDTHAPPVLMFTWGSSTSPDSSHGSFQCVLARATQRFIMFLENGTPVRARLQVTFNEFTNAELEAKETKRQTADYSKIYIVGQSETLSAIAGRLYNDPRLWRPIALVNDIENPRELPTGLRLLVPQLPYRDPNTGKVYPS